MKNLGPDRGHADSFIKQSQAVVSTTRGSMLQWCGLPIWLKDTFRGLLPPIPGPVSWLLESNLMGQIFLLVCSVLLFGASSWLSDKESAWQGRKMQETQVPPLGREDSLEEGMATHSSILAWKIPMDRGAWQATVHRSAKNWLQLSTHAHTYSCCNVSWEELWAYI